MKTKVEILKQETLLGREFNIYGDFETPLFLAKDVAEWIEYGKNSNGTYNVSQMVNTIDDEEKLVYTMLISGQNRDVMMLTEEGVYEVLMQSRKPIAKKFKKGIKEILKSIRKHGAYMTPQKIEEVLYNPDLIIGLATNLKQEQEKNKQLEADNCKKQEIIEIQHETINELAPKADYTEKVLSSKDTFTTTQIAKEFGWGAQTLNSKLKSLRVQYKHGGQWLLYAKFQNKGYTKTNTYTEDIGGEVRTWHSTVWTEKGRKFIYDILKKESICLSPN